MLAQQPSQGQFVAFGNISEQIFGLGWVGRWIHMFPLDSPNKTPQKSAAFDHVPCKKEKLDGTLIRKVLTEKTLGRFCYSKKFPLIIFHFICVDSPGPLRGPV